MPCAQERQAIGAMSWLIAATKKAWTRHKVSLQQLDQDKHGGAWLTWARQGKALQPLGSYMDSKPNVPWAP